MLIIAGSISTKDGERDALLAAAVAMVAATHAEAGCQEYVFSPDPDDANRTLIFEMWDDQDALQSHFDSEHMAAFQGAMGGIGITGADVKKYTISDVGPVR